MPLVLTKGIVHSLSIHIPWTSLTSSPIQVTLTSFIHFLTKKVQINTIELVVIGKTKKNTTTTTHGSLAQELEAVQSTITPSPYEVAKAQSTRIISSKVHH